MMTLEKLTTISEQLKPGSRYTIESRKNNAAEEPLQLGQIVDGAIFNANSSKIDLCLDTLLKNLLRPNASDLINSMNELNPGQINRLIELLSQPAQVYLGFTITDKEFRDQDDVRHHKFHCKVGITRRPDFERAKIQTFIRFAAPFRDCDQLNRLQALIIETLISSVVSWQLPHIRISEILRVSRKLRSLNYAIHNDQGQLANVRSDLEEITSNIIIKLGLPETLNVLYNCRKSFQNLNNQHLKARLEQILNDLEGILETIAADFDPRMIRDKGLLVTPKNWYRIRQSFPNLIPKQGDDKLATKELSGKNEVTYLGEICRIAVFTANESTRKYCGVLVPRINEGEVIIKCVTASSLTSQLA